MKKLLRKSKPVPEAKFKIGDKFKDKVITEVIFSQNEIIYRLSDKHHEEPKEVLKTESELV